uniref:Uncharacterized protein n=1 Tax=Arundo donax TaxID=35708 RepID=A0A0A8ZGY5_ARUDO
MLKKKTLPSLCMLQMKMKEEMKQFLLVGEGDVLEMVLWAMISGM